MQQVDELQKLGIQVQKNIKSQLRQSFKNKFKIQKQVEVNQTVLSAFGLLDKSKNFTIISIGFGTKSLPYNVAKLYPQKVIKDMHAQILACRGFRKWIIQNLPKQQQTNCYFKWDAKRQKHAFKKQQFRIFIYSSQVFCGDCMIDQSTSLFSGAKPLTHFASQTYQQMKYEKHVLRTKPGRLDLPIDKRTLSLSCSDKIGLWNILGLQGKRLFSLVCPIYLDIIWLNCKSKQPKQFEDGVNLVKRITMLKKIPQQLVKRKIFNIIIKGKQQAISKQFQLAQPKIICLPSKQKQSVNSPLCGIIYQGQTQWLTGKSGILQGRKLSEKLKNSDFSQFSSVNMYKSINEKEQKFKYEAIKDRIKMLFGIWTDKFRA